MLFHISPPQWIGKMRGRGFPGSALLAKRKHLARMKARCMEVHIYPEPCQPHGTVLKAFIHLLSLLLWQFQPGLSILILAFASFGTAGAPSIVTTAPLFPRCFIGSGSGYLGLAE
jgi:hypothetical protein